MSQSDYTSNFTQIAKRMEQFICNNQKVQFNTKQLSSQLNVDHSKLMTVCLVFSALRLIEINGRNYKTYMFTQVYDQNQLLQNELKQKQFNSTKDQYDLTLTICFILQSGKKTLEQILSALKNQKLKPRVKTILQIMQAIQFVNIMGTQHYCISMFFQQHLQENMKSITPGPDQGQNYLSSLVQRSTPQSLCALKSLISIGTSLQDNQSYNGLQ